MVPYLNKANVRRKKENLIMDWVFDDIRELSPILLDVIMTLWLLFKKSLNVNFFNCSLRRAIK